MKAKDVMTNNVISVSPDVTVREVASQLLTSRISAVPVVDEKGRLVGIVSEGDLLRRVEIGTAERHRSWWLQMWTETDTLAADYVKTHGRHVRDVMTKEVITVNEDTPVAEIAELLESKRIKRVPVLRDGKLVGIVSRANLLHGLAAMPATATAHAAPDEALRNRILSDLDSERWTHTTMMNVIVKDGVAELWGFSGSDVERRASRLVVENVPGVKQVVDHRSVIPAEIAHA